MTGPNSFSPSLPGRLHATTLRERDLVQYAVELRPHLVSLGGGDMAKRAIRLWLRCRGQSLWFRMIEIEVSPAPVSAKRLVSLTVTSAPLKAPGK
jgi:shikimate kinase